MTRIHGRGGVAYLSRNSGDAASPVAFLSEWEISYTREIFDVTAITDAQIIYAAGDPDISGSFTGYFDTATVQTYAAAVDGLPRNLYLYPAVAAAGPFFSGTVLPDYRIGGGVTAAVSLSVAWAPASRVITTDASAIRAGLASAAAAALPTAFGYAPAGLPGGAGAALQPSVTTSSSTNASAVLASAAGAAQPPAVGTTSPAGFPSVPGVAVPGLFTPGSPSFPGTFARAGLASATAAAQTTSFAYARAGLATAAAGAPLYAAYTALYTARYGEQLTGVSTTPVRFPSVPGLAIPGQFTPGEPGVRGATYGTAYAAAYA